MDAVDERGRERPGQSRRGRSGGGARRRHAPVGEVGPALRGVRPGHGARRAGRRRPRLARRATGLRRGHDPQRLPRLRRRRHFRPGARLDRSPRHERVRRLRVGRGGHRQRAGADPGRVVRRRAGGGSRHHAQGLLHPRGRGPQGRPRLAPLPPARRDEPHLLRALRATTHGSLRSDGGGLRPRQGEESAPRFGQPERALPQRGHGRGGAGVTDGGGPAPPARDLRHVGRWRRTGALEHGVRATSHRRRVAVGHRRRRRDGHTFVPEHGDRDAELLDGLRRGDPSATRSSLGPAAAGFRPSIATAAYAEAGIGPEDVSLAEVYDLSSALELDWYEDIGLCGEGEAEKLLHDGATSLGGRVPVNPSGGLSCFGEAIPAQAIAQVCEGVWQLRGDAAGRQVEGARVAVTANQGLFGHGSSVVLSR